MIPGAIGQGRGLAIEVVRDVPGLSGGGEQQGIGGRDGAKVFPSGSIGGILPGAIAGGRGDGHTGCGPSITIGPSSRGQNCGDQCCAAGGILVGCR